MRAAAALCVLALSAPAHAQSWLDRPLPWEAGDRQERSAHSVTDEMYRYDQQQRRDEQAREDAQRRAEARALIIRDGVDVGVDPLFQQRYGR